MSIRRKITKWQQCREKVISEKKKNINFMKNFGKLIKLQTKSIIGGI